MFQLKTWSQFIIILSYQNVNIRIRIRKNLLFKYSQNKIRIGKEKKVIRINFKVKNLFASNVLKTKKKKLLIYS